MTTRYGMIIKLKPEKYEEYKALHKAVWPEVLDVIRQCNIRNYSIYHKNGLLFSYFEYDGEDFNADLEVAKQNPRMREFWELTDACQEPVEGNSSGSMEGNWWIPMEELFYMA